MIESYEILEEDKMKKVISINENNESTMIICPANGPLQAMITQKNKREILSDKKRRLEKKLSHHKKLKKKNNRSAIHKGIISIITVGLGLGICLMSETLIFDLILVGVTTTLGVALTIDSIKEMNFHKRTIRNLKTIIDNIDMMITRTFDMPKTDKEQMKQEYFEEDKCNSHITYVCVDKMVSDQEQSINSRWYALNHDKCTRIVSKKANNLITTFKLAKVFHPINTNDMETERFVKSLINSHGKRR